MNFRPAGSKSNFEQLRLAIERTRAAKCTDKLQRMKALKALGSIPRGVSLSELTTSSQVKIDMSHSVQAVELIECCTASLVLPAAVEYS